MNFLETTLPRNTTLKETVGMVELKETVGIVEHCSVTLLKSFPLLAVGMMLAAPGHPTASTRSGLVCSREGFAPMFAATDVCPKKALMLLTVMYVPLTVSSAVDLMGTRLSKMHMEVVC